MKLQHLSLLFVLTAALIFTGCADIPSSAADESLGGSAQGPASTSSNPGPSSSSSSPTPGVASANIAPGSTGSSGITGSACVTGDVICFCELIVGRLIACYPQDSGELSGVCNDAKEIDKAKRQFEESCSEFGLSQQACWDIMVRFIDQCFNTSCDDEGFFSCNLDIEDVFRDQTRNPFPDTGSNGGQ